MSTMVAERDHVAELEADWAVWLAAILPDHCTAPFAPHHEELWDWFWSVTPDTRPDPPAFIGVWPRGGAKSTSAEAACAVAASTGRRRYGLYVCDTQDRSDDHVGNVGAMLESERVGLFYPDAADRAVGKFGNSKGWRRNRLRTRSGFILDAAGLDTAVRGIKIEDQRPDFVIFDDIDSAEDSPAATARKVRTITKSVLPATSDAPVVLAIQNLVIPDGVFAQLTDGRARFLRRRHVSGPIPALVGMKVERIDGEDVITEGSPTWAGQNLDKCREQADDWSLPAFLEEAQHEVEDAEGAMWCRDQIAAGRVPDHPELDLCVVSVDPSGGKGKGHDTQGIVAVGRGAADRHGYVLEDATPTVALAAAGWGRRAVELAADLNADRLVYEENYGGDSMENTLRTAADRLLAEELAKDEPDMVRVDYLRSIRIKAVSAEDSKADRAVPVSQLYEDRDRPETWADATVHHVGTLGGLEREMCRWDPGSSSKSPNRVDALVHGIAELGIERRGRGRRRSVVVRDAA